MVYACCIWILPWTVGLLVNNLMHAQFTFPVVFVIVSCRGWNHCMLQSVFWSNRYIYSEVQRTQVARDTTVA